MSPADRTENPWLLVDLSVGSQTSRTYEGQYYREVSIGRDSLSDIDLKNNPIRVYIHHG